MPYAQNFNLYDLAKKPWGFSFSFPFLFCFCLFVCLGLHVCFWCIFSVWFGVLFVFFCGSQVPYKAGILFLCTQALVTEAQCWLVRENLCRRNHSSDFEYRTPTLQMFLILLTCSVLLSQ